MLYANFVQSVDGVVAISEATSSGPLISGNSLADRFVMGLLRAFADAVLVGAATVRDTPKHHWTADHIFPALAGEFEQMRHRLGRTARPELVVLTNRGDLDLTHPALQAGALILTTDAGAARLRPLLPVTCRMEVLGRDSVDVADAVDFLHQAGHHAILSEAGPSVMGQLLAARLVDDLFLTVAPVVAGRGEDSERKAFVEGRLFLPDTRLELDVLGLRRNGQHLFLRYGTRPSG